MQCRNEGYWPLQCKGKAFAFARQWTTPQNPASIHPNIQTCHQSPSAYYLNPELCKAWCRLNCNEGSMNKQCSGTNQVVKHLAHCLASQSGLLATLATHLEPSLSVSTKYHNSRIWFSNISTHFTLLLCSCHMRTGELVKVAACNMTWNCLEHVEQWTHSCASAPATSTFWFREMHRNILRTVASASFQCAKLWDQTNYQASTTTNIHALLIAFASVATWCN